MWGGMWKMWIEKSAVRNDLTLNSKILKMMQMSECDL